MMLRFIHTADLHLDSPFKGLAHLPDAIREQVIQSTFQAFDNLVRFAIREQVDFIVISGDVFDGAERSLRAQLFLKKEFEKLALEGIPVYMAHGNHDPLGESRLPIRWPDNVYVFGCERVERIPVYKQGVEAASIYGISYPQAKVQENLSRLFRRETDAFSIAVLHTNCDAAHGHENYAPCTRQDLLQAGFDYWALGHVHTRQVLHENPPIVYPGNLQGRHVREQGERGFYLVEVNQDHSVRLTFQSVSEIIWLEREVDFSAVEEFPDVWERLEGERFHVRQEYGPRSVMVRCIGAGQTALAAELADAQVVSDLAQEWRAEEEKRDPFVWLESFHFRGSPVYDRQELKASEGIYADILQTVDQWLDDPQLREEVFRNELKSLFEHHRARTFLPQWSEEEQAELIRQAETLLLAEWLRGEQK